MNRPWLKLFVGDWLQTPGLRSCSAAARALAIDLICLMHQADPYGHLRAGRKALGPSELARIVGERASDMKNWLEELLEAGVFARSEQGEVYSPRMIRDEKKHQEFRKYGARRQVHPPRQGTVDPWVEGGLEPGLKGGLDGVAKPPHARARSEVRSQKSEELAAARPRRKAATSSDATLEHAEATRVWCKVYEKETGQLYGFDRAKDGKQIRRLLQFPDFSFEELARRATRFLRDPYWAERGVDLTKFGSQWVAQGNAGRKVDPSKNGAASPSEDELAWCRRALKDPNPILQDEARKRLQRWGMTEGDLLGEPA